MKKIVFIVPFLFTFKAFSNDELSNFITAKSKAIDSLGLVYSSSIIKAQEAYKNAIDKADLSYQKEIEKLDKDHEALIKKLSEIPSDTKKTKKP